MDDQTAQRLKRIHELTDELRALMDEIDAHTRELGASQVDGSSASPNVDAKSNVLLRELTQKAAALQEEARHLELGISESDLPELHDRS